MNFKSNKLVDYLSANKEGYILIGGNACALYLEERQIIPRTTVDYDIVLCFRDGNSAFGNGLAKIIEQGKYENNFSNGKRTAYRFENPKQIGYPRIIELFCSTECDHLSSNKRFAKLNLVINEEKASAMTINETVYQFMLANTVDKFDVLIPNIYSLIVLKVYAYYENLKLYKEKKVHKTDYLKHRSDVILLLLSMYENEIQKFSEYPQLFEEYISDFVNVINDCDDILKNKRIKNVNIQSVVDRYKRIFIK